MNKEEYVQHLLGEFNQFEYYTSIKESLKRQINMIDYQLVDVHSPALDKIGSSGGFGIPSDEKRLAMYENKAVIYEQIKVINSYLKLLIKIINLIKDAKIRVFMISYYIEKKSLGKSANEANIKNRTRAWIDVQNSINEILNEETINNLQNTESKVLSVINHVK